jgi:hypothetical protein
LSHTETISISVPVTPSLKGRKPRWRPRPPPYPPPPPARADKSRENRLARAADQNIQREALRIIGPAAAERALRLETIAAAGGVDHPPVRHEPLASTIAKLAAQITKAAPAFKKTLTFQALTKPGQITRRPKG